MHNAADAHEAEALRIIAIFRMLDDDLQEIVLTAILSNTVALVTRALALPSSLDDCFDRFGVVQKGVEDNLLSVIKIA